MAEVKVARTWLDRAVGYVSPSLELQRIRARIAADLVLRHYEAASTSRRTQGWNRSGGDANAVAGPVLARLRGAARDLVRNNGHASKALRVIGNHVVGWGIVAKPGDRRARDAWKEWAGSTDCDSDGRNDLAGIQKLVLRTAGESGEVLIRRRFRRPEDGLSIPMQLQVIDPDHIDTSKHQIVRGPQGQVVGRIIYGIEFDLLGRRTAYWLFPDHPGSSELTGLPASRRIPAESIIHVYEQLRPGQVRGVTWFAPILVKFKDFDEYSDATLMKQKIAACLAVLTSDSDGNASPLGTAGAAGSETEFVDSLEPGMILNVPPGRSIQVVQPPQVREYGDYASVTQHEIAAGLGMSFEDFSGDYSKTNFSSSRMSRQAYWGNVEDWQRMMIGQFCTPVWRWAMEAAVIVSRVGMSGDRLPVADWTAPAQPMIDPSNEGLAIMRNVRAGIQTLPEAIRERGYDPDEFLAEYAKSNEKLDELGIVLDSDPRRTTQAGNPTVIQQVAPGEDPDAPPPAPDPDEPDDDEEEEDAEAERAQARELALIDAVRAGASRPVRVEVAPGAIQVDARTTIEAGAVQTTVAPPSVTLSRGAVSVDARTTIAEGAVQMPMTFAENVSVPAGRRTVERDADGNITALVAEPAARVVTKPEGSGGE